MSKLNDEISVAFNGGPSVPVSVALAALEVVKARNSGNGAAEKTDDAAQWGNVSADRLRSLVDRIERLESERKALSGDIKDIYLESKSAGFDVKVLRQLIRIRKQEPAAVEEQETLLDVYRRALNM